MANQFTRIALEPSSSKRQASQINTVNSLSTVMAELKATGAPQGYTATTALAGGNSNALRPQISGTSRPPQITLVFGADGRLTVTADGKPLV